jgi:hypothetical protein
MTGSLTVVGTANISGNVSMSGFVTTDSTNKSLTVINEGTPSATRGIALYQNNDGIQAAAMQSFKSRGTNASPTAVASGDIVGGFTFRPYISTAYAIDQSLFGASMTSTTGISQFFIAGTTTSNYTPNLLIAENGNITIGNLGSGTIITSLTLPTSKLQVVGNAAIGYSTATAAPTNGLLVAGNVGIGTTGPTYRLDVSGSVRITGSLAIGNIAPSATLGRIDASNDVVAFSTSDVRFKTNIFPISSSLDKIKQISGVEFDWIPDIKHGYEGHDVGVIAQELEKVLPEVVTIRDNGYLAVKYEKIVPLLIEAIKEQQNQIDELRTKLG